MAPYWPSWTLLQFVYVNQSFAPSPDRKIGDLTKCFGSGEANKLVLYYAKSQMWGVAHLFDFVHHTFR